MTGVRSPFGTLPLGAVRPRGWLLAQLRRDLEQGFAARLDQLTPHAARDLFRERIASSDSFLAWWDAETRGNWLWGYVMMAHLADAPAHRRRVAELVADLLATQDEDGYIGIYPVDGRYRHAKGENGELWAQSRALLALIAFYEATGAEPVLEAVRRAVDLTLRHYPDGTPYFQRGDAVGQDWLTGLTHGLCYLDVLEWLCENTGDEAYARAGIRFYREFSSMARPFPNDDLALPNLVEAEQDFSGHAVHTAEHLRALLWVGSLAPELVTPDIVETALLRLQRYRLPSGALLGDENIHGLPMPEAAYEFCTSTELAFSLSSGVQKLGLARLGDWLETLAFNAVQGARMPNGSAIAYLSADTRLLASAARPDSHSHGLPGRRYKFSPTHDDVACCCNPNAVRFLPQLVSRMWLRSAGDPGLAAVVYGPCELRTQVGDVQIRIVEETEYPFSDTVDFLVLPERPVEFTLTLRQPGWAGSMDVTGTGVDPVPGDGWLRLRKLWAAGDRVRVRFAWDVRAEAYGNGEVAALRGPLQYALPLDHRLEATRDYPVAGLHDYDVLPRDLAQGYRIPMLDAQAPGLGLTFEARAAGDPERPWDDACYLLHVGETTLMPMGCTLLRRAAFPADAGGAAGSDPEARP
jgi:hypothetical protein